MYGRFRPIEIQTSANQTASGSSSSHEVPGMTRFAYHLTVTGTPGGTSATLDVTIEDSPDGSNWASVGSFAQVTAAGTIAYRPVTPTSRYVRASWTLGGTTPDFTFSIALFAKGF